MDAAVAAAMSDPERNRHFRRRWSEGGLAVPSASARSSTIGIGTLGLALQEALRRANTNADCCRRLRQPDDADQRALPEVTDNG
jgi:hypothetical protein